MSAAVKTTPYVRKDSGERQAFRESCFELLWLFLNQIPEGKQRIEAARLAEVPANAMITRTDQEDGSATFEISGGALPQPTPPTP